jgi:hypothetical protein
MENMNKPVPVTFRAGHDQDFVEWKHEFSDMESLRNYMKLKMIRNISLRVFVRPIDKMITLKSFVTPSELTTDNYKWLLDADSADEKFIVVNHRRC